MAATNPFLATEPAAFLTAILALPEAEVLAWWARTPLNDSVGNLLAETDSVIGRSMMETSYSILSDQSLQLSPLTIFTLIDKARQARSRSQFEAFAKQMRLPLTPDCRLSEIKPLAVNSFDALIKIYLCLTFQEANIYAQMGAIMRQHPGKFPPTAVEEITLLHARLALLVRWYRLSLLVEDAAFLQEASSAMKQQAADDQLPNYPDPQLIEETVKQLIDAMRRLKTFPPATLRLIADEDNFDTLFVVVDAVLTVMRTPPPHDELLIRRRVAQHALVYSAVVDNTNWYRSGANLRQPDLIR